MKPIVSTFVFAALVGGAAKAQAQDRPQPPWLREIVAALDGPATRVSSAEPGEKRRGLTNPLNAQFCVHLPVSDPWTLSVDVRFAPKRTYRMTVLAGLLPDPSDAYAPVLRAAAGNERCDLPKSGNSVLQIGTVWLAFPSYCSDGRSPDHSLPVVVGALKEKLGARVSERFILGGCGRFEPVVLTSVAEFLATKGKFRRRADDRPLQFGSSTAPTQ